jgi:hypothetical protein
MFNFKPLLKDKNDKDEDCCSISSEFERNLDFLEEVPSEEELNIAKLGSISNIKSNSNVTGNNSNSSGGKSATESEHYDEVDEYSFEKNEMEKLYNKRLSLGSNNQIAQFNTNPHLERLMRHKWSNRGQKDQRGATAMENDPDDMTNSFDYSAASHQSQKSFQSQHSRHSSFQSNSPSQSPVKNKSFLFNSNNEIHNINLNLRPNLQSQVNLPNLPQGNNYHKRRMSSNVFPHSTINYLSPLSKLKNQAQQAKPAVFNLEINDINDVHVSGSIPNTVRDNSYMNTGRFTGISGPTAMTGNTRLTNLTGMTGQTGYTNQSGNQLHQENNLFNTSGNNMNMNMMHMSGAGVGLGGVSQRVVQGSQGNFNMNLSQNINMKMNNSINQTNTNKNLNMNVNNQYMLQGNLNQMIPFKSTIMHPHSQGGNFSNNNSFQNQNNSISVHNNSYQGNITGNNSYQNQNNSMSVHNNSYQGNITGNNSFQNTSLQSSFNNATGNIGVSGINSQIVQLPILPGSPNQKERKNSNPNSSNCKKNKNLSNLQKPNPQPQFNPNSIPNFLQDDQYVLENILLLLKDQNGCRMVQKKIEEKVSDKDYINSFYEKISPYIYDIVNDQFGNYVIQKYFEIIQKDKAAVTRFFERIALSLFSISVNPYGTRFFQRALECMTPIYSQIETESLNEILKDLIQSHIMDLILDTNGNHVFQKILALFPKDKNDFFFDELTRISFSVAKLKQGGCIFQKAFDHASLEQKKKLVFEILKFTDLLINDEYGNFIIQQIVFLKYSEFNDKIFKYLKDNLGHLAKKKFSSNVIDKVSRKFRIFFFNFIIFQNLFF